MQCAKLSATLMFASFIAVAMNAESSLGQERDETAKAISFNDLKFEAPAGARVTKDQLPDKIRTLDERKVTLRGYIYGASVPHRFNSSFMLVRDRNEYYPWPICNNLHVTMAKGELVEFTSRPIKLSGILRIKSESKSRGKEPPAIYQLADARQMVDRPLKKR